MFRPEQIALLDHGDATVDLVEYYGHDAMVFVRAPNDHTGSEDLLRVRCSPTTMVQRGDKVGLAFKGDVAVAFPSTSGL